MKRFLTPLFWLFCLPVLAQKVDIVDEDVLIDGAQWCKIYKQKGVLNSDFTLASPEGKKFILLKYIDGTCHATLLGRGTTVQLESQACLPKYLAKQLYNMDVLEDGVLNELALQDFISMSGAAASPSRRNSEESAAESASSGSSSSREFEMVERDRSKMIQVFGNVIRQDFQDIGTIQKDTKYQNGQSVTEYQIFLPNGQLVATARYIGTNALRAEIITAKDNRKHFVTAESSINRDKAVIQVLVRMLYL